MNTRYRIAINFGDNDYGMTYRAVMSHLKSARTAGHFDPFTVSRETMLRLLNEVIPACYVSHQSRDHTIDERTRDWLAISTQQLLFDDDSTNYLKDTNRHNGECIVWDLNIDYIYLV